MSLEELIHHIQTHHYERFITSLETYLTDASHTLFDTQKDKKTLLMHIASSNQLDMAQYLLSKLQTHSQADYFKMLNALDSKSRSALLFAAQARSLEMVTFLQENGADIYFESIHFMTPFAQAAEDHDVSMIKFLWHCKPEVKKDFTDIYSHHRMSLHEKMGADALVELAGKGNLKAVELLLHYIPIDSTNCIDETALIRAARYNQIEVVTLLVEKGANMSLTNMLNDNAFSAAFYEKAYTTAQFLLEQGINVNKVLRTRVEAWPLIKNWLEKANRMIPFLTPLDFTYIQLGSKVAMHNYEIQKKASSDGNNTAATLSSSEPKKMTFES